MIVTVTGEIPKEKLGFTLPHEHILIDLRPVVEESAEEHFHEKLKADTRRLVCSDPYFLQDNAFYLGEEKALFELLLYKEAGGVSVADATLGEIGRSPAALRRLSARSGVQILMGSGHYIAPAHNAFAKSASEEALAEELVRELTVGVNGVRAGFIGEIGTSAQITEDEWKCTRAAFRAQRETGAAIHFHTALWEENGVPILAEAKKYGVPAERICIDHVDVVLRQDYCERLMDAGAYIEFDNCGKEYFMPRRDTGLIRGRFAYDYERAQLIAALVERGYKDRILLSNDICLKSMLATYGGNGFAHVARTMLPMLRDCGVSGNAIRAITVENPANFFDIAQ